MRILTFVLSEVSAAEGGKFFSAFSENVITIYKSLYVQMIFCIVWRFTSNSSFHVQYRRRRPRWQSYYENYGIKILSSTLHLLSVYIKMRTFKTHVLFVDSNCLIKFVLHSIFLVGTRVVLPNLKANNFRQALY